MLSEICWTCFLLWVRGLRGSGFKESGGTYSIVWTSGMASALLLREREALAGGSAGSDSGYKAAALNRPVCDGRETRTAVRDPCS